MEELVSLVLGKAEEGSIIYLSMIIIIRFDHMVSPSGRLQIPYLRRLDYVNFTHPLLAHLFIN